MTHPLHVVNAASAGAGEIAAQGQMPREPADAPRKLADEVGLALAGAACRDPRVFVLDGDLADSDGAHHFARQHPQRFLMAGIAEQGMVSTAAGMAEAGARPWVFSFAAFLCCRAFDQIRIGLSQTRLPVALVGSHAGGLSGRNGKTHAAPNDIALMLSLPEIAVWAPADALDVQLAVADTLASNAPAYVRTPRARFEVGDTLPGNAAPLRWLAPPAATTVISTGLGSRWALDASRRLAQEGVSVGVLHLPRVRPLPPLEQALAGVERVVVLEDHSRFGGLASLLAMHWPGRALHALGWPPDYPGASGDDDALRALHGLDADTLVRTLRGIACGNTSTASMSTSSEYCA